MSHNATFVYKTVCLIFVSPEHIPTVDLRTSTHISHCLFCFITQVLESLKRPRKTEEKVGLEEANIDKNRSKDLVPGECSAPLLGG